MTYTIRRPRPAALVPLLGVVGFLVFAPQAGFPSFSPLIVAAFAALFAYQAWQRTLVLRVNEDGVRLGRGVEYEYGHQRMAGAVVPWPSIRDVVVVSPGPLAAGDPHVGVRLKPGAPLPAGARAVVHDPDRPDDLPPDLSTAVPARRFDRGRLAEAVAAHGAHVTDL